MGIFECRTRESSPKRQRICKDSRQMDNECSICQNSKQMDNDCYSAVVGPKGLIKKHEFVRLIIQCLQHLGFPKTSSCLEMESGISYKSKDFEVLESDILNGNWEQCMKSLEGMKGLVEELRSSAFFLVLKQRLLECSSHADDSSALTVLRKQVSELKLATEEVNSLAFDLIFTREKGVSNVGDDVIELRKKLLLDLEKLLPPPITLPERRLEHLVETVVSSQIDSCLYHNYPRTVSVYEDHCCVREQLPTETVQILTSHQNEVWSVQFSNNGEYLASSSSDCTAIIWKVLADGTCAIKHALQGHQKPVSFSAWSPDDTMLLTRGNLEVVKLWDVETGTCKHTFGDHGFLPSSCAWFPDSKRFVCGSSDPGKGICMWDCEGNELKVWKGPRIPKVLDLGVTVDGNYLISLFADKEIRVLNLVTYSEHVIQEEHPITSLSVSRDGKFFTVNLNSQAIHLWEVLGKCKKPLRYTGHMQRKYVIRSCFGGCNDSFIASGSEDSKVYVWNRKKSEPLEILSGHSATVNCVSWNPKNPWLLASASDDNTVRLWRSVRPAGTTI